MPKMNRSSLPRRIGLGLGALTATLIVLATAVPTARAGVPQGWSIVTSPNSPSPSSDLLMGTTCTGAWNCWAVGGAFAQLGNNSQPHAIVDRWNGSTWSAGPDVTPPGSLASLLWNVDCVTSSDCWAVGAQELAGQKSPVSLAEHWDGSAWSVVPTPDIGGYLFSVTCTGTSNCWAVGTAFDANKNPLAGFILHWDGTRWSEASPAPTGQAYDQFDSVTCTGATDCWAVGFAGPNPIQYNFLPGVDPSVVGSTGLAEHWNGAAWSVVPTPAPASPSGRYLSSVTCTESSDCWAVGSDMDAKGNPSTTLVEHWDGSTWTTTPSPDPSTPANVLNAVTCLDASKCWATGSTDAASGNNVSPSPFIENWNGSTWSVQPSPSVVAFGSLGGVACVRNIGCFAAGFAATNVSNDTTLQTLIEQLKVGSSNSQGLWMSGSDGGVFSLGNAAFFGSAGNIHLNAPVVGMAATPNDGGYWLVGSDGGVFSFGNAGFHGSTGSLTLNKPIVGMASTPDGRGYWLVASDGGVFAFGDAGFHGSTGSIALNKPIVGMASTPDGGGYWLVASDGGVFAFGDAAFHGSTGAIPLASPIVGMASTPDGGGYWLVASDGGVFALGDAVFDGSVPRQGIVSHAPVTGIVATTDGRGYWIVGQDGSLYSYGDAGFLGSLVGLGLSASIVGAAA